MRFLYQICGCAAVLAIRCAKALAWCVIIVAGLCLAFVLSAQLTRLYQGGGWRAVPLSELLQILGIQIPAFDGEAAKQSVNFLLDLPANLVSAICVATPYLIKRYLDAAETRLQRRGPLAQREAHKDDDLHENGEDLLGDIEEALDKWRKS